MSRIMFTFLSVWRDKSPVEGNHEINRVENVQIVKAVFFSPYMVNNFDPRYVLPSHTYLLHLYNSIPEKDMLGKHTKSIVKNSFLHEKEGKKYFESQHYSFCNK